MDFISWEKYILENLSTIAFSAILALLGLWLARIIRNQLIRVFAKSQKNQVLKLFLTNTVYTIVLVVAGIMVLGKLGVPTASLITILGTSSLAVGLAMKDFLANIAAGVILVFQRPFEIGDLVELSGILGTVETVDLFHTKIKTPNNEIVVIPNGKLIQENIVNKAHEGIRRLELTVLIAYRADLKKAKSIIHTIVNADMRVLSEPRAIIGVSNLADSGVELIVRVWARREDFIQLKFDCLEQIKLEFEQQGIEIPFPQLDVFIKNNQHTQPTQ